MTVDTVATVAFYLALLPILLSAINVWLFRRLAPLPEDGASPSVSLLIPARNEEANIGRLVRSALASKGVTLEVVVLDDHSTDATAEIVREIAETDGRVRLEAAPPLPEGWSGKQHACRTLAGLARFDRLVFVDADVVLTPDALGRIAREMERRGVDLLSGFPRQMTETFGETITVSNIMVFLLGYMPMVGERFTNFTGFACGCGQLMATTREGYRAAGTHEAVKTSLHDGVTLPRAYRRAGRGTAIFDGADLATCRMYRSFGEAWQGFAKNATEGMATPVGLPIWTVLLFGGHVLPFLLVLAALLTGDLGSAYAGTALWTVGFLLIWRLVHEVRFGGSIPAALLHPLGIATALAIQWYAFARQLRGGPSQWRGRSYPAT